MDTNVFAALLCVVLPIAIVLIVSMTKIYNNKARTRIIMKAIEANASVDVDKLTEALRQPERTPTEVLNRRLLRGCICLFVGGFLFGLGVYSNMVYGYTLEYNIELLFCCGGTLFAIGVSYMIVYFVSRKEITKIDHKKEA